MEFSSYQNDIGYRHFSVCHKAAFKATYKNAETNETVEVNTNRIEGAWKYAKLPSRKDLWNLSW